MLFPIIGVGASAGGLGALERFLKPVPKDCGHAFVIVQHLDPTHATQLVELLQRSLMALLGLAVAAFAFGYVMAGRVLSPLGRITRTARQVASSDRHKRIELEGPDDEADENA